MPRYPAILFLAALAAAEPVIAQDTMTDCLVQAGELADLGAQMGGIVAAVHVDRADAVRRGQILVELEASVQEAELALARLRAESDVAVRMARARAETAELNAKRLASLRARDLVPEPEAEAGALEARTARLEEEDALQQSHIAQVQFEAAQAALERTRVRAPFDGVVVSRTVSQGERYAEQGALVTVARIDPLHVDAYLPAMARDAVAIGQMAAVSLETGGTVDARITVIDIVLDAATGTFGLRLELPNPDGTILAGQSCSLDIFPANDTVRATRLEADQSSPSPAR